MSEPLRIALVGATGLIGGHIVRLAAGQANVHLLPIARRATPGAVVADPAQWPAALADLRPDVLISALGTTWNKAGRSEAAFRAVDQALVLACAGAARAVGTRRMVTISSVGADAGSGNFYLRVKGEVERQLGALGFERLDILRPGLLRGERKGDRRVGERIGIALTPLADRLLHGRWRAYGSIPAEDVARASLALAQRPEPGRFVHDNDAIRRAAGG